MTPYALKGSACGLNLHPDSAYPQQSGLEAAPCGLVGKRVNPPLFDWVFLRGKGIFHIVKLYSVN